MTKKLYYVVIVLLILHLAHPLVYARPKTNLRGKVVIAIGSRKTHYPLSYKNVTLLVFDYAKREYLKVADTYTDKNGMFYFYEVSAGEYFLDVNDSEFFHVITVKLPVSGKAFQDVPLIEL